MTGKHFLIIGLKVPDYLVFRLVVLESDNDKILETYK